MANPEEAVAHAMDTVVRHFAALAVNIPLEKSKGPNQEVPSLGLI